MLDLRVPARDGTMLAATRYAPAQDAGRLPVVLLASALGVRRQYYKDFAGYLAERGFHVLAFDYRGIGESRPASLRGFRATLREWATEDLAGAIDWLGKEFPGREIALVGHSAGGWLTGLTPNADRFSRLVLVASQSGHWRHWRGRYRARTWAAWHVVLPPIAAVAGYVPGWVGVGADLPAGVARDWARWGRHPRFVLGDPATPQDGYARIRAPVLAHAIEDDLDFAPEPAVDALLAEFKNAHVEKRVVRPLEVGEPVGHFGFFRARFRDRLWAPIADWLSGPAQS